MITGGTSIIPTAANQNVQGKQQPGAAGDFAGALSLSDSLFQLSSSLLDNLLKSRRSDAANDAGAASSQFAFSSDFTSTFGNDGPLPAFINDISAKLHLTAEQNQALQNIAIRNKDITKTPDNVQKLAQELKAAGIGA